MIRSSTVTRSRSPVNGARADPPDSLRIAVPLRDPSEGGDGSAGRRLPGDDSPTDSLNDAGDEHV